ncbi:hypothetical protein SLS56_001686 [Neofusicoccum ribis]|uniref:Apple domain-containing protein n=1 Tax=Neofusicoccum ribis TaxID=45134 RepID=A0ABR3T7U4_9PEZI
MFYTFLFLVGSLHAANVAAQNCAPQYAFIADFLDDYAPANSYCVSKYGAPTSIVTVTSTATRFQKRAEATLAVEIHAVDDKPKPGSPLAIANAEAHLRRPSSVKEKRQGWFNFNPISNFNQMTKNPAAQAWVQGICSCIVDPVTRTATAVVTKTILNSFQVKTSTSTAAPSSTWKSSAINVPSAPAIPSSSSTWKSSAISIPSAPSVPSAPAAPSSSSTWKSSAISVAVPTSPSTTLSTFSTAIRSSAAAPSLPSSGPGGANPPPSNGPGGSNPPPSNNPAPPASSVAQSLTSAASAATSAATSALPTTTPLSPVLQSSNCTTGPYSGTGACDCAYTVFCGYSGSCGAANETQVTAAPSWQACGLVCDNDSACTAWSYSYATGLCTEIVDQDCTSDVFDTTADPSAVLGVYEGGCQGVCLT